MSGEGPVLVTGAAGQLARELQRAAGGIALRAAGRPAFDFDRPETLAPVFAETAPSLVVNAAAWTAVDLAETHAEAAGRANRDGPARLAGLCAQAGIPLIHISTDYVFDGRKGAPYRESDAPCPTGVYGRTKLEGEQHVLAACPRAIVLRTSWLYAAHGQNFVRTILDAASRRPVLRVVADQVGCPTAAADLAAAIMGMIAALRDGWQDRYRGVFHAAGTGDTTWHGLALAAVAEAARHGRAAPPVEAITTAEWPTPARRPPDSRLDCQRLHAEFQLRLPDWRDSLRQVVAEICRI